MAEDVQEHHFKEFLVICILSTLIVILGYYALSQKNIPKKEQQASPEDLMSTMLQTKGAIESSSFCLVIKENGDILTEANQKCASEETLRALLSKAIEKTDRLRVEGSEKLEVLKLVRLFEIAREVGFQEMKYQIILFVKEENKALVPSKSSEESGGENGEESH
ncbi:MAG: hypothetical protein AABZ60_00785 [Planctomycetota bacterium]